MMVRYPVLLTLLGFCAICQLNASYFLPQENTSSANDSVSVDLVISEQAGPDSLALNIIPEGNPINPLIFDMLDSIVNIRFFSNTSFPTDTSVLNVHNYAPGEIPVFSDSVLQARIEVLNRSSLIELSYNKHVKSYLDVYAVKKRALASKILGMAEVYFPLFEEFLDKYNLPVELKYLAVVESALNPIANSRAGAKGLWQFMFNTGKLYGLKANSLVDDRFDPYKSTDAACRHLKDLYGIYGDWELVLAAYNSGAGNVNKAIRRAGGTKNYWAIWSYLPRETRGYVPAFVAVVYLMNYASEHNIYPEKPLLFFEEIDTVLLNDVLSFDQISEFLKIPEDELRFLNPSFKTGIIPATHEKQYVLRLPNKYIPSFIEYQDEIFAFKTSKGIEKEKLLTEVKKAKEQNFHTVRSGESLGVIAKKYHCSVTSLKSWNNLRSNMIHPGQKLIIGIDSHYSQKETTSSKPVTNPKPVEKIISDSNVYVVSDNEFLTWIAQKHNCSVDDLMKWNSLQDSTVQSGQKLIVKKPDVTSGEMVKSSEKISSEDYIYHIVRKGDTLWDIANKYEGVTVEQIRKLNNITNSKKLIPGQKLRVGKKG